ncbi:hypothetical protein DLAC_05486 [Tieghemostelium lacteum]|uniref:MRH domain-containing protein n=1 Tax=Tieghemostelium lacteum TaxID=361077 RepID=A0A151ZG40_TIELA|nr:hypothetical protein DLAC_05486 [Tieghemostelium lacteum]|eukprot:KYQ92895.1 hypothetical protein DLAC_05486 [Tieghemostelium lacteum]
MNLSKLLLPIVILSCFYISSIQCQNAVNNCTYSADGYSYNFGQLATLSGYYYTKTNSDGTKEIYYVNVCNTAFGCTLFGGPTTMNACKKLPSSQNLSLLATGHFDPMPTPGNGAYLSYVHPNLNMTVSITLLCDKSKPNASIVSGGQTRNDLFEFTLSGEKACGTLI